MNCFYIMGGGSLGFLHFQKCVILAFKKEFSAKKDKKKSQNPFLKKMLLILDNRSGLILRKHLDS